MQLYAESEERFFDRTFLYKSPKSTSKKARKEDRRQRQLAMWDARNAQMEAYARKCEQECELWKKRIEQVRLSATDFLKMYFF